MQELVLSGPRPRWFHPSHRIEPLFACRKCLWKKECNTVLAQNPAPGVDEDPVLESGAGPIAVNPKIIMTYLFRPSERAAWTRQCLPWLIVAAVFLQFVSNTAEAANPVKWDPIPPADLASLESALNPGIGSEILLSRQNLEEDKYGLESDNYVRAKIYNQGGIDKQSLLRITYRKEATIRKLAARVVKPDGTAVELGKADFHESTLVKEENKQDLKQIAFAFPNLRPGDIVEYQWRVEEHSWIEFWTYCQEEIPVREFRFAMDASNGAVVSWQNCAQAEPFGENTDRYGVIIRNLPAYTTEDYMPPEMDCRAWIRLLYKNYDESIQEGWLKEGKFSAEYFSSHCIPYSALKKKAVELTSGITEESEKLRRLYDFCQTEIVNYTWNDTPEIAQRAEKLRKQNFQTARQTLDQGIGSASEIDNLFAGLARACGFEVRKVRYASRNNRLNVKIRNGWEHMYFSFIAVKVGGAWQYYSPGDFFVPFGMHYRAGLGVLGMLCDEEKTEFVVLPTGRPEDTTIQRKGRFELNAEGALEGEVEEVSTGCRAQAQKWNSWASTPADLDREQREEITKRLPSAEVTDIRWENLRSRDQPVRLRYHVVVPGYAQRVGQRLVWAENFFAAGETAKFASVTRRYPILFPYPACTHDDLEIKFPDGFVLDQPSAPRNVGQPTDPIRATFAANYDKKRRTLVYQRDFLLGADGLIAFSVSQYPWIKQTFDALHESDAHKLVLKPRSNPAATTLTAPAVEPSATNSAASAP